MLQIEDIDLSVSISSQYPSNSRCTPCYQAKCPASLSNTLLWILEINTGLEAGTQHTSLLHAQPQGTHRIKLVDFG